MCTGRWAAAFVTGTAVLPLKEAALAAATTSLTTSLGEAPVATGAESNDGRIAEEKDGVSERCANGPAV